MRENSFNMKTWVNMKNIVKNLENIQIECFCQNTPQNTRYIHKTSEFEENITKSKIKDILKI